MQRMDECVQMRLVAQKCITGRRLRYPTTFTDPLLKTESAVLKAKIKQYAKVKDKKRGRLTTSSLKLTHL